MSNVKSFCDIQVQVHVQPAGGADLGEGTNSLVCAAAAVVVGALAVLNKPGLQQGFEQPGLHRIVCILLNSKALVVPA